MQIKYLSINPNTKSSVPVIDIQLFLEYEARYEPISFSGYLTLQDGTFITFLNEIKTEKPQHGGDIQINFYGIINNKALDFINDYRDNNPLKDVVFTLFLNIKYLIFKENNNNEIKSEQLNKSHTIPSNNWILDFVPKLGGGKFMILEIPLIEYKENINNDFWRERIQTAFSIIKEMEENINKGDWQGILVSSREYFELFKLDERNNIREKLIELLQINDLSKEGAENLIAAINNLFHYASKFIHRTKRDSNDIQPKANANKEDAYMMYTLSCTFLNLILRKIKFSQE
jgi:hypothetical protein